MKEIGCRIALTERMHSFFSFPRPARRIFTTLSLLLLSGLLAGSCARTPAVTAAGNKTFLIVNMTVRGQIQPSDATVPYYYFCLINLTDNQNDAGPVPILNPPWGNGFAADKQPPGGQGFVGFVRYDRFQGQGGYGLYGVPKDATGTFIRAATVPQAGFVPLGQPDSYRTPQQGESLLTFQVDLNRLKKNPLDATEALPQYVQINLLTTDKLPQGADDVPKAWDAFGNSRTGTLSTYVTLQTTVNRILRNSDLQPDDPLSPGEPTDIDVKDRQFGQIINEPNLDIVDWSIEIRHQ
jgi:hypothetical protein